MASISDGVVFGTEPTLKVKILGVNIWFAFKDDSWLST
jgi:hypothetical protein